MGPGNIIRVKVLVGQDVDWRDLNQLKNEAFDTGHVGDAAHLW
jgi:hypothetical protein